MKILFVHQNFPGQFGRLATQFAADGHEVVALGMREDCPIQGVRYVRHGTASVPDDKANNHRHTIMLGHLGRAYGTLYAAQKMKDEGFEPDLVVVNTGWGEGLFLKDVWPKARHVAYFEYYYQPEGQDVGFDPEFSSLVNPEILARLRIRNMAQLGAYYASDAMVAPTLWQRDTFPENLRKSIKVIHDGIDTEVVAPRENAFVTLASKNIRLDKNSKVVTFCARNLEPYRGVHSFFRAIPDILALDPEIRVLVLGGFGVSYGRMPDSGGNWADFMRREMGDKIDWSRVHIVGQVPYNVYLDVLAISSAHVYLTYPFVLSWSLIEAMSMGTPLVVSDTAPVLEVIRHEKNGVVVPFFDPAGIAAGVESLLSRPEAAKRMGAKARMEAKTYYDFKTVCLPKWRDFLEVPDLMQTAPATGGRNGKRFGQR